jgi:geranylgeranyl pyrophosphate synthase
MYDETRLSAVKLDVNRILQAYFDTQVAAAAEIDPAYLALWETISGLTMHGGKRLRPFLTVLGYEACGGSEYDKILHLAAAQELLHSSLLIHDDIMDRDYVRYGRDNVAGVYQKNYRHHNQDAGTVDHYAAGAALLAGDLILSAAHQFVAAIAFDETRKTQIMEIFAASVFEVIGGQLLDTEAAILPFADADSLKIARYKTASYSFVGPLCIGAAAAGAPEKTLSELRLLGREVGIAYQLVDDMLGVFGREEDTGKPAVSDLREGKRTYVMQQTMRLSSPGDQKIILRALGNPKASPSDLTAVRHIVEMCGARTLIRNLVAGYRDKALASLDMLDIQESARSALKQLVATYLRI